MKRFDWQEKVVLLTGASSGLGYAMALEFAQRGAWLALASRREDALLTLAEQVHRLGGQAMVFPADISQLSQVADLVQHTLMKWGRIDAVICNAGQYLRASTLAMPMELVEESLRVNFLGHVYTLQATLPYLLAQNEGRICLICSLDAIKGIPPDAPYVAAKFALRGYGEVLRQELQGTEVRLTIVFPGRIDTPMLADLQVPAISAKMKADWAARQILRAAARGQAELYLPASAHLYRWLAFLSPRGSDWAVRRLHLSGWEKSDQ